MGEQDSNSMGLSGKNTQDISLYKLPFFLFFLVLSFLWTKIADDPPQKQNLQWRLYIYTGISQSGDLVYKDIQYPDRSQTLLCATHVVHNRSTIQINQNKRISQFHIHVQLLKMENSGGPLDNQTWHTDSWPQQKLPKFSFHSHTTSLWTMEQSSILSAKFDSPVAYQNFPL